MTNQKSELQLRKGTGPMAMVALVLLAALLMMADSGWAKVEGGSSAPKRDRGSVKMAPDGTVTVSKMGSATKPQPIEDHSKSWANVFVDDFESGFPGTTWEIFNSSTMVDAYWGAWTCWSGFTSSHSVGCAAAGTEAMGCGQQYPNYMSTWMIHGPFTMAGNGYTAANFQFNLNLNSETDYDQLFAGVSVDGLNYFGNFYSGIMEEHVTINLDDFPGLGNYLEAPQVYIGFYFGSDSGWQSINGAQIDDVVVMAEYTNPNVAPTVSLTSPNGGEILLAGQVATITYSANDPDAGPTDLAVGLHLSTDNGAIWSPIAENLENAGAYQWTVPDVETSSALVMIIVNDGQDTGTDQSNGSFIITTQTNSLGFGQGGGPSGSTVSVPLDLVNDHGVKGLQLDVLYDPAVATFVGVTADHRGAGMTASSAQMGLGTGRIIMYFDDENVLSPGAGVIGFAIFTVQGSGLETSNITPGNMILSGPVSEDLPITGNAGFVYVEAPTGVPVLQISALKNPGRPHLLQVLVRVASGSGNSPALMVADEAIALTPLSGSLYLGAYLAESSASTVVFNVTDTNIIGAGTSQVTVSFP